MRPSLIEDPRLVSKKITAHLELPDSSFVIHQRDDSAEFDDEIQPKSQDPKFVVFRKANKVEIRVLITPNGDLKAADNVVAGFTMQYTYSNVHASSTPDKKGGQQMVHALTARVYINAGKILGSAP